LKTKVEEKSNVAKARKSVKAAPYSWVLIRNL